MKYQLSRKVLFAILIISSSFLSAQNQIYNGFVTDANTGEQLIFVSISKNSNDGGTTTDLDGHFSINATIGDSLRLSYVGYAKQIIILEDVLNLKIKLNPIAATLQEIIVRPKENTAWRIIRLVLSHRSENDPQQYEGYQFKAYHKTVMTIDSLSEDQTWKPKNAPKRQFQKNALEKATIRRQLFSDEMHFWLSESLTETFFRYPSQHKEKILANQSSMPNDITAGLNPIDFQPFGFYKALIRLEFTDQNYVNPISKPCFNHYDFEIKDTLFHSIDTTFIIAFKPIKGKHFIALEGLLYINTHGYAVENVIASSADKNQTIQFDIQQQSTLVDGRWFPQQLNTDLFIEMRFKDRFIQYAFRNRSLISEVDFSVPDRAIFNHYLRENLASTTIISDSLRPIKLSQREKNTYSSWDSLAVLRGPYRFLKAYNGLIKIVATGLLEGKYIDLVISDILQINEKEGLRLGLGFQTNPNLFKRQSFYGYSAYGFDDKEIKYGGSWDIKLDQHRDLRLRTSYKKDIEEPGQSQFLTAVNHPWTGFSGRNFSLSRFDGIEQWKIALFHHPHPAWQFNVFAIKEERQPTYDYHFFQNDNQNSNLLNLQQGGVRIRWSPKEKLIKMDRLEAVLFPSYPIVDFSAIYGSLKDLNLSFIKINARLIHEIRWKYLGSTALILEGGYIDKTLPYSYLFQVAGNENANFSTASTFNTAGVTEFTNQEYVYAFITHDFGYLLGKIDKTPWFRPELSIVQNIGWGRNHALAAQHSIELKDFSKTYLESGIGLKNILRISYFDTAYFGLGGIVYYRWGAYQLDKFQDNLFFQFQLSVSI